MASSAQVELANVSVQGGATTTTTPMHKTKAASLFGVTSSIIISAFAIFCLVIGIMVLVIPASWVEENDTLLDNAAERTAVNYSCPAILPSASPHVAIPVTADRLPFINAWAAYVNATLSRPEGVRSGCEPLYFPATGAYRGVALVWHGFSSCPQEMAILAPPLAANGFDVIIPLMPGHGNAIRYEADAPNYLWGWLTLGLALQGLACMGCLRCCPFASPCRCADDQACCGDKGCCGHTSRSRCIYGSCIVLTALLIVSVVAIVMATNGTAGAVYCLSLSFTDGVGGGCGGFSEYNDNLPSTALGYTTQIDEVTNSIVRVASGEKVLVGLSGGGGAALHTGTTATNADGTALFARQLLVAPYIDAAVIGPILEPVENLGLGEVKVDFGQTCRSRRANGKRGYCNYKFNRIAAMREVGQQAAANLVMPPGASVEVVMVQNDNVVTNDDIAALADGFDVLAAASADRVSSHCMATHVDSRHSPLSIWNNIHMIEDDEMEWVPELVCQFVQFLVNGTPMPVNGTVDGHDRCATTCGQTACAYDCHADAFLTCGM